MWGFNPWRRTATPADGKLRHDDAVLAQIHKRLTLNLLIQGAAAHTFITASHLVRDELEMLRPGLTLLYHRFALSGQLNYCIGDNALMFGFPNLLWGFSPIAQRPLRSHPLLSRHGNRLAWRETRHLRRACRGKRIVALPGLHWFQFMKLMIQVSFFDTRHAAVLQGLAVQAASAMWGFPAERLDARLTQNPAFGNLQTPRTALGRMCRQGVIGYGGVERRGETMFVVAKAWVFPILVHELVKGIVELICLHGLSELDDEVYRQVVAEADQLEYEAWLLQAGPEMWRRLLSVAPREQPLARTIMRLAQLEPAELHELLGWVLEEPQRAALALR